jgi:phosphoribosyl-ATP pyrophosphohydrolase
MAAIANISAHAEARGSAQDRREIATTPFGPAAASAGTDRPTSGEVERLFAALDGLEASAHPRTARLLAAGRTKLARKLMEEAGEVAIAVVKKQPGAIARESADVLYQLTLLWHACGISPDDVWQEMHRRADLYGLAEKILKPTGQGPRTEPPPTAHPSGRDGSPTRHASEEMPRRVRDR